MTGRRVLFVSGSIGLGHAARDLAIARELRALDAGVEIAWLAGDPARRLIADAGETLLAESAMLDESASAERIADRFSLNLTAYVARARAAWARSVAAFARATTARDYDVVVGDETYELVGAFARHPELKRTPFAIIYDFVGLDATTWRPAERLRVHLWNRGWCADDRGKRSVADLTIFVGEPADVPDRRRGSAATRAARVRR